MADSLDGDRAPRAAVWYRFHGDGSECPTTIPMDRDTAIGTIIKAGGFNAGAECRCPRGDRRGYWLACGPDGPLRDGWAVEPWPMVTP